MHVVNLMRRALFVATALTVLFGATIAEAQRVTRPGKRGRHYRVRIDSAPQQAAIYLQDEKHGIVGYTPWNGRLQKGPWKVIIKKDGWETATKTINIRRTRRVQDTFIPLVKKEEPGILDIQGAADPNSIGAEIFVDGQPQGKVPAKLKVDDGRHLVEVRKPGFDSFSQWTSVKEGQVVTINPVLKQNAVGSVLVEADVPEAEVYVDGNPHPDKTPTLISGLPAGPHIIEIRKKPSIPWKQTINVEANKTVKVRGQLKATMGGAGGSLRILSNADDAQVLLDGTPVGKAPIDITDVKVGEHVVEVRAPGFQNRVERVKVGAGQAQVLKLDLIPAAGASAKVRVVSPVPEAVVFVDGARLGSVPQEKELEPGEHFVVVQKPGFTKFEEKIQVEAGKAMTVTAKLRAAGGLRIISSPTGAAVTLDGEPIGVTPLVREDIDVGEHVLKVSAKNFYDFEQSVTVEGGKTGIINATLERIETGPTVEDLRKMQRSQSSFGAKTLAREKVNVDVGTGYPYFFNAGFHIGAGGVGPLGLDASLLLRTFFQRTELSVRSRVQFFERRPFSLGAFVEVGGGNTFFDDSERNSFFFKGGLLGSLTGLGRVTITGRVFLEAWSDRYCPGRENGGFGEADPADLCEDYLARIGGDSMALPDEDFNQINRLIDDPQGAEGKLFDRDNGARLITSLVVEFAVTQRINGWIIFEGSPFQGQRGIYADVFNSVLLEEDPETYVRLGTTFKF